MLKIGNAIQLSASDLVGHLNCRNLTELDLAVAKGTLAKPRTWNALLDVLRERGLRHEQGYVDHLSAKGLDIETVAGVGLDEDTVAATARAMRAGREVIVQGAFLADNWGGRTDVLLRVDTPSPLGDWSYEVVDTKLSRETKGGTVLQLSLYSDLVGEMQGLTPQRSHVIAPWSDYQPQTFRTDDFAAYYRRVRASLQQAVTWTRPSTSTRTQSHFARCAVGRNVATPSVMRMIICLWLRASARCRSPNSPNMR